MKKTMFAVILASASLMFAADQDAKKSATPAPKNTTEATTPVKKHKKGKRHNKKAAADTNAAPVPAKK